MFFYIKRNISLKTKVLSFSKRKTGGGGLLPYTRATFRKKIVTGKSTLADLEGVLEIKGYIGQITKGIRRILL